MAKKRHLKKKVKIGILITLIVLIVIIIIIFIANFSSSEEKIDDTREKEISVIEESIQENDELTSDLLKPQDLNDEIVSRFSDLVQDGSVIKIHYKLTGETSGEIDVYYNLSGESVLKITIDIESKKITGTETINDDEYLLTKSAIEYNLKEDVEGDYSNKSKDMDLTDKVVNIIITNSEIVINVNPLITDE